VTVISGGELLKRSGSDAGRCAFEEEEAEGGGG
jgi:hypothetical protein